MWRARHLQKQDGTLLLAPPPPAMGTTCTVWQQECLPPFPVEVIPYNLDLRDPIVAGLHGDISEEGHFTQDGPGMPADAYDIDLKELFGF